MYIKSLITLSICLYFHASHPDYLESNTCEVALKDESPPVIIAYYFSQYDKWKQNEEWMDIIKFASKAVVACQEIAHVEAEALIHTQVASIHYYLGDYANCIKEVENAYTLAEKYLYPRLQVKSLYILSAAHRGLANHQVDVEEQVKGFQHARYLGKQSLDTYKEFNLKDSFLKAKIFYNLGAAEADDLADGDIKKAEEHYLKASELFDVLESVEELNRCSIRLARLKFMNNELDKAQDILNGMRPKISLSRTLIHFEMLRAEIFARQGKIEIALNTAFRALKYAKRLNASKDVVLVEQLINQLKIKNSIPTHACKL